jgi:predicted aldo/keto reductase-like oxidoreductase
MQYRKFGKLDWEASVLGFGTMRLPQIDNNPQNVDENEAIRMIRYAINHGVNYIDTAYPYHGGKSEVVLGKALEDGYRKNVKVATKLPTWNIQSAKDFDVLFDEQLNRLQVDKLDFYLLHGLNKGQWNKLKELGILRWAEHAMANGRFDHLGFSFHDQFSTFKEIIDDYDNWTLCQIQYNYIDINYQAGTKGLKYASDKGLAVVIMEPLRGGKLTKKIPDSVTNLWTTAATKRTPSEWGLQWVWNHPEVSVVLSGMSNMEQVVNNVFTADLSGSEILVADELALVEQVRKAYQELCPIPCTDCGYCMPCSNNVQIPRVFDVYNDAVIFDDFTSARFMYNRSPVLNTQTNKCLDCGECLEKCPQNISIPEWLKRIRDLLG